MPSRFSEGVCWNCERQYRYHEIVVHFGSAEIKYCHECAEKVHGHLWQVETSDAYRRTGTEDRRVSPDAPASNAGEQGTRLQRPRRYADESKALRMARSCSSDRGQVEPIVDAHQGILGLW